MSTSRKHHEPLPLEARKVLWKKVWDRLLAPPALATDRADTAPADFGSQMERQSMREGDQ
jgi:hypothetical protein